MGWWLKFLLILRLTQPGLAGVGAGAELGKKIFFIFFIRIEGEEKYHQKLKQI